MYTKYENITFSYTFYRNLTIIARLLQNKKTMISVHYASSVVSIICRTLSMYYLCVYNANLNVSAVFMHSTSI